MKQTKWFTGRWIALHSELIFLDKYKLKNSEIKVLTYLGYRTRNFSEWVSVSNQKIADECSLSRITVQKCLKKLKDVQILESKYKTHFKREIFIVIPDEIIMNSSILKSLKHM